MPIQRMVTLGLVVILGACGGPPAPKAPAPDPAKVAAEKEAARLFEEGKAKYAAGDLDGAIAAWEGGFAKKPDPVFQYNLGQAHHRADRPTKAAEHLRRYLELAPTAENRPQVEKALQDLEAAAAHEESLRLFDAGTKAFEEERYDEAIASWEEGYAKRPSPVFLYNIGQAHRAAGRKPQAREYLERYLAEAPADSPNRANVERLLKELAPRKPRK